MAIRYVTKGRGKNRRVIPIGSKKKGVSVRSVSLQPTAIQKINKEQGKLLNKGETANFSKALNAVVLRAKRDRYSREGDIEERIAYIEEEKKDISNNPQRFGIKNDSDFKRTIDEGNKEIAKLERELIDIKAGKHE